LLHVRNKKDGWESLLLIQYHFNFPSVGPTSPNSHINLKLGGQQDNQPQNRETFFASSHAHFFLTRPTQHHANSFGGRGGLGVESDARVGGFLYSFFARDDEYSTLQAQLVNLKRLDLSSVQFLSAQLVIALEYMHSKNIPYRYV
jgi:hypothetical protein